MNKRAPLIAAGVAAALVIVAFLLVVKPKMGQVAEAKTQLETKQQEAATLTTLLATLRDDQANESKYQDTIAMVDQRVPPLLDQQGLLTLLRVAGEQSGIDHLSAQFGTPAVVLPSGVSTISVTVSLQGRFFTIAGFFDKVERLPRAAKVTQFTLTPGGSALEGSAPAGTMLVQATIEFYTSDTVAGPGSDPGSQPPAAFSPAPTIPVTSGAP